MSQVASSPAPSFGYGSTVHRVLAIPELLQTIFSFGTRASNVSNALVCRGWREPALDNVWREVDDMYYLLQLLAPFHRRSRMDYYVSEPFVAVQRSLLKLQAPFQEFSRIPNHEDWTRFIPYARRVRSLKFGNDPDEKAQSLGDSVFDDLARTRTTLEVLPNLRCLWWNSIPRSRHATLFMHDKVTEFAFKFYSESLPSLSTDIVGRMPSLRSLKWTNAFGPHNPDDDQELLQLLLSLQKLREVTPPKDVLDSKYLKTLSLLPELEVIQFDTLGGIPYPIFPLECTLQEGAFPMLYDLCLNSNLDDIRVYLTEGASLPQLRNLTVESVHPELPLTVQRFLTDVTGCYPALELVSMDIIVPIEDQDDCKPLLPEHLYPILSLKQLAHLELRHNLPLRISEVDLAEIGAALPSLGTLVLNPEPLQLTRPEITLHSLLTVAQHFPNLSYLGIYLDAEDVTMPMPWSPGKTRVFPYLRTLHVGVSPIASEVPVALFLSHLLSENERVEIQSGTSWNATLFEHSFEYSATVFGRCRKWEEVANTLPLLLQLRKEEKAHRQDIEKEVEDLRMRNEVIMGKMQMKEGAKSAREGYDNRCIIC